jgi:hypothetical protein
MSLLVTFGRAGPSQLSTNNILLSRALAPQCLVETRRYKSVKAEGAVVSARTSNGNNVVCSERATCVYRGGVFAEEEGSKKREREKEVPSTFLLQTSTTTSTIFHYGRAVRTDVCLPHRHTEHFLQPNLITLSLTRTQLVI